MMKSYVVHTQTGSEDKVRISIQKRMQTNSKLEALGDIFIPTEQVSEIRAGKKRVSQRKFLPGYILVQMDLNEQTYLIVKSTPGVTGFIGMGRKPLCLPDGEVESIIKKTKETAAKPSPKIVYLQGEPVRVTDGPFLNFNGVIEEVYPDKGKLKVSVSIFGRATPVELEYWQIEKT
jgi:transcription termination/antitermination protein NusG